MGKIESSLAVCASSFIPRASLSVGALLLAFALPAAPGAAQSSDQTPGPAIKKEVTEVRVPVVVIGDDGQLFTELKKGNFAVLEDGQQQEITGFNSEQSPLTLVLLLEYSQQVSVLRGEVIRPAGILVSQIVRPDDYVAMLYYDSRPHLLADFTRDRQKLISEVRDLVRSPPLRSDSNLYDALDFVLTGGTLETYQYKGLREVEGRTGVLLVASGLDTFSSITYDQARDIVARAGVPVYAVAVGEMLYTRYSHRMSASQRLEFLQARNTLKTFCQESGGRLYRPRFSQAVDSVLESIAAMLRHQYTLTYRPANPPPPGEERTIEVRVDVNGDGRPDNDRVEVQHRTKYVGPPGEE